MSGEEFPDGVLDDAAIRRLHGECDRDGSRPEGRWLQSVGAPILLNGKIDRCGVAVNTDVTQTRLQDEALRKSEKLAAVGQLASSIAHEINNPLESITNLLYLMQAVSVDGGDPGVCAAMAQGELSRVTEITLQTLRFHRQAEQAGAGGSWRSLARAVHDALHRTTAGADTFKVAMEGVRTSPKCGVPGG